MSNQYIYLGNKQFAGPTTLAEFSESISNWKQYVTEALPRIPYIGKEDDFKPDQICEEGKEIRIETTCKILRQSNGECPQPKPHVWADHETYVHCMRCDLSIEKQKTVILPNTPVVSNEPCPNCKETIEECACMRNKCDRCGKPVGNITFTACDECWNILVPTESKEKTSSVNHDGATDVIIAAAKYGFWYANNVKHHGDVPEGNILQWLFSSATPAEINEESKEKDNVPSYSEEEVKEIIRYCAEQRLLTQALDGVYYSSTTGDFYTEQVLLSWKKQKEESK